MPPAPQLTALPTLFPPSLWGLCSTVIRQAGSSLSPHTPRSVTRLSPVVRCCGGDQGQPSNLRDTGGSAVPAPGARRRKGISAGSPPGPDPGVGLTCQASRPHVMQLAG